MHKVQFIRENYKPVYPEGQDWDITIEYMKNSPRDFTIVQTLIEELAEHGKFREPIRLSSPDEEYQDVENGTHRMVASILSGAEEIEAEYSDITLSDYREPPIVVLTVYHAGGWKGTDTEDEDVFDCVIGALRSFKFKENGWIEVEMGSGTDNNGVQLFCLGTDGTHADCIQLQQYAEKRLAKDAKLVANNVICKVEVPLPLDIWESRQDKLSL